MQCKVLVYYTIIYDSDPHQVYYFTDFNKVLASVESSMYGYSMDEDNKQVISVINKCITTIKKLEEAPIIPIVFESLQIMINRWEMDNSCDIYKVLQECHCKTNDENLKEKIESLFSVQKI